MIYLDHAATTPIADPVRNAMLPLLGAEFGNPSSRHPLGVRAAQALDRARRQVAAALVVPAAQVIFTSGGTEAANLALFGLARARRGRHVLLGATEHACVRAATSELAREGYQVESIALSATGDVDLARFSAQLRPDTALVAQMLVNNEYGTIYPVARMAKLVRARASDAALVVDAVQAFGKLDCALAELGCDALFLSAHKIGGPKGAGALALARPMMLAPLLFGGGQESGLRAGTENVLGIVGLGAAAEWANATREADLARVAALRARLVERLLSLPGFRVLAPGASQLPHIVSVLIDGAPAEVRMHHLERHGVYVSAGSACQKHSRGLSPALTAIGLSEDEIRRVVRVSLSATTTEAQIDAAAAAFVAVGRELEHAGA